MTPAAAFALVAGLSQFGITTDSVVATPAPTTSPTGAAGLLGSTKADFKKYIDVSGDLSLFGFGGYGVDGHYGITVDGRPTGIAANSIPSGNLDAAKGASLLQSAVMYGETAITFRDATPKPKLDWRLTVVEGNMISDAQPYPGGFGNQSQPQNGTPFSYAGLTTYIQHAEIKYDSAIKHTPVEIEAGRFPYKISSLILQRPDNSPYYTDPRWDSGSWGIDGAIIKFGSDTFGWRFFAGLPSDILTFNGIAVRPMTAGTTEGALAINPVAQTGTISSVNGGSLMPVGRILGTDATVPVWKIGSLRLGFVSLQSDSESAAESAALSGFALDVPLVDRVTAYGASLKLNVFGIPLHFDYAKSNEYHGSMTVVGSMNEAIDLGMDKKIGIVGVKAGYQSIGPNFGAPGDWGRIGTWLNPTGVSGAYITPSVAVGGVEVGLKTVYSTPKAQSYSASVTGDIQYPPVFMSTSDHSVSTSVQLKYKVGPAKNLLLGVEDTNWSIHPQNSVFGPTPGSFPEERWYDFGFSMTRGTTDISILYQISDYENNGSPIFRPFVNSGANVAKGGLLVTQITTRF